MIKKNKFVLLLFLSITSIVYAQNNYRQLNHETYTPPQKAKVFPRGKVHTQTGVWTELSPRIPKVDYLGVDFVNEETGWCCGELGVIIKTTDSGKNWTISETPTEEVLIKIRSFNGNIVLAVGYNGIILRSTDGGENFELIESGTTARLWSLEVVNDTLAWACGMQNTLLKSTDAGLTWQGVETPAYTHDYWWIEFFNENLGAIACNYGIMMKTTDGGNSWQKIQVADSSNSFFSVDIIDSLHFAVGGWGNYHAANFYSSDGGNSWTEGYGISNEDINCIEYIDPDTGYVVATHFGLMRTTNRGENWEGVDYNDIGTLWDIKILKNEQTGYVVGDNFDLRKAEAGFTDWNNLVINDDLRDVFFIDENKGFAAAFQQVGLLSSTDGGMTWDENRNIPDPTAIYFVDEYTGFIGTRFRSIYKTTDGGVTWIKKNIIGELNSGSFSDFHFVNENLGWSFKDGGQILKTSNGGEDWIIQQTIEGIIARGLFMIDSLNGWIAHINDLPYKTTDGGINWIRQDTLLYYSNDVYFKDIFEGYYCFGSYEGGLFKTTDSGVTWTRQIQHHALNSLDWLTANHGFVVGTEVFETSDNGVNWVLIPEMSGISLRKFHASGKFFGYAVGWRGSIYKYTDTLNVPVKLMNFNYKIIDNSKVQLFWTTITESNNQGFEIQRAENKENWRPIGFVNGRGTTTELSEYNFRDDNAPNGINYYRLKQIDYDGGYEYSDILRVDINKVKEFRLFQNYPNPFNPSTKIKYNIPKPGLVTLKIYDILGRNVAVLVNKVQTEGEHEVTFDASGLSTGVYIYKLQSGDFNESKKFLLMK